MSELQPLGIQEIFALAGHLHDYMTQFIGQLEVVTVQRLPVCFHKRSYMKILQCGARFKGQCRHSHQIAVELLHECFEFRLYEGNVQMSGVTTLSIVDARGE